MPAPVVQARVSFINHCDATTTIIHPPVTSAYQAGWPATNAKYPQQPFTPAKGTMLADTYIGFDFGAAKLVEFVLVVNPNCARISLGLTNASDFSTYAYLVLNQPVVANPWNRRRTWAHVLTTPQTVRYLYVRADHSGGVTDGAAVYSFGGIWAGPLTSLPRDLRWGERPQIVEPHIDTPLLGGGTQRVSTGRTHVEMRASRLAITSVATPGTNDELGVWLDRDHLMGVLGHFAWYFNRGKTSEGFIFRKMNDSAWGVAQVVSEDELILHEVVGP